MSSKIVDYLIIKRKEPSIIKKKKKDCSADVQTEQPKPNEKSNTNTGKSIIKLKPNLHRTGPIMRCGFNTKTK